MNDFSSEFAVAVFPLPLFRDRFHGVPVLGNLPVFNPPEIVKRRVLSSGRTQTGRPEKLNCLLFFVRLHITSTLALLWSLLQRIVHVFHWNPPIVTSFFSHMPDSRK